MSGLGPAPGRRAAPPLAGRLQSALGAAALAAVFLLSRPYRGIVGDSVLYIGRALANLDPSGLGEDPMWILDGQMRFSAFPLLAQGLIPISSPAAAASALALTGLLLWAAALLALATAIVGRNALGAAFLACALFPPGYSAYGSIYFAEPIATPRVFAEAAVLFALAALLGGRLRGSAAWLAAAGAMHPILALSGAAACFVYLCLLRRKWLWAGLGLGLAIIAGAAAGVPVLARLMNGIDAQWLAMLRGPVDSLFLTQWPAQAWALKAVQAATVALAAMLSDGVARRFFVAILATSAIALAASLLFGDLFPLLLVAQAQPWRASWLLAVAAPLAFIVCARAQSPMGPARRLPLAVLAAAWSFHGSEFGALLAFAALFLCLRPGVAAQAPERVARLLSYGAAGLVAVKFGGDLIALRAYASSLPEETRAPFALLALDLHIFAGPAALAIFARESVPDWRPPVALKMAGQVALCALAAGLWRIEWDPFRASLSHGGTRPELVAALSGRPGPILWVGGNQESWYWAGRPNWAAGIQGNGVVFSRELTVLWFGRMSLLRDIGWLADGGLTSRRQSRADPPYPDMSAEKVNRVCGRADAPAWLVAPSRGLEAPEGGFLWRAPARRYAADPDGGGMAAIESYAVLPCAGAANAPR